MAKPDYNLCAVKDDQKMFHQVGAAWVNDKDQISIRLNPCVTLTDRDDVKLYLFPANQQPRKSSRWQSEPGHEPPPPTDDDVPF